MANYKSYLFQFISILFSFVNVKLMIEFLGDEDYSTWLVIFSIAGLIYALDLGIGSSVRNQLARLISKNATSTAQARLVFGYYKLIIIFAAVFCLFTIGLGTLAHAFGWIEELGTRTIVVLSILIFVDFATRAHHPVFAGLQQPHSTNFALAAIQMSIFLMLYFLLLPNRESIHQKLWVFSFLVFGGSILINAMMLVRLNHLIPLFAVTATTHSLAIRLRHSSVYLKRGLPFFFLQIAFAVLGQIPLYFIYQKFPTELIVEMAIADKVYAPFIVVATIIMYPFWSGYTLLMHRGESGRIRKLLRRQEYLSMVCLPILFLSIVFYDELVQLWLNRTIENSIFSVFALLKVFSIFLNSIYSYFMNAVGKLRPQLYVYSIGLLVALPIIYFGSEYQNIYVCLFVTPTVLLVSALTQRHYVFNVILSEGKKRTSW